MACVVGFYHFEAGVSLTLKLLNDDGVANGSGDTMTEPDVARAGYYEAAVSEGISGEFAVQIILAGSVIYTGFVTVKNDNGTYIVDDPTPATDLVTPEVETLDDLPELALPTPEQIKSLIHAVSVTIHNRAVANPQPVKYEELGAVGFRIENMTLGELMAYRQSLMDMLNDPNFQTDIAILMSEWDNPRTLCHPHLR